MNPCTHDDGKTTLFCSLCNKEREKGSLRRVRIQPRFTGPASLNPAIERFWETGDVEHL
jgi:hypothetical protein